MKKNIHPFFKNNFPNLSDSQFHKLTDYVELILDYNRKINLISRADTANIWEHHILPSITALKLVTLPRGISLLDMGSGAGLPGIPIKICRPDIHLALVDSIRKKTLFLKTVVETLKLTNVEVYNLRLEPNQNYPSLFAHFDVVTVRAVGQLKKLLPVIRPLLNSGGSILAWKGQRDVPELKQSAAHLGFHYQVLDAPQVCRGYSKRVDRLLLFKITP